MGGFLVGRAYLASDEPAIAATPPPYASDADVTPRPTPANPDDIDTTRPGWALDYRAADAELPRYDQVINGIPVGPDAKLTPATFCPQGASRWVTVDEAAAADPAFVTPLDAVPDGAVIERYRAVECAGVIGHVEASIVIPADADVSAAIARGESWFDVGHGGQMDVYKTRADGPGWASDIAAERWEPIEVNGLPAALGHAILRDEFGPSAVVVWDPERKIQVVVRGIEIELADLLAVAAEATKQL